MLRYANAAASLITTRKGALRVMPQPEDVERLLGENQ
jgi:fructokinase